MKNTKLGLIGFVIPILWLISSTTVNAQTNVSIEPKDLTVVGTKLSTVKKRPIFISHDKAIAIQITPRSLYRMVVQQEISSKKYLARIYGIGRARCCSLVVV